LYGAPAGVLAAFALSCFPGVTLGARDYLMDFPAAALATAAVALLVEADFGRRRGAALAFGALVGLTLLTKTMALVFLAVPIAEAFWRSRRDRRACANLFASLLLALLVASCWWGPNHASALAYLWRFGFTDDALPFAAAGASPLSPRALAYYPAALVNEGLGPLAALLLVLALLLVARPDAFLLRWFGIALAVLTLVPNKSGDRYILGLLPPLALALAARSRASPRGRCNARLRPRCCSRASTSMRA
jgi:4-amino-4-deoxy-L-arabinose transferase-like glycosyltransferase